MSGQRGFGVAAGLDPQVAGPLAARCAELGYDSMWSNDHPGGLGLETVAAFADAAPELELGVAVMALDRHTPADIAAHIDRLGLDRERLWLGVGAGFSERPLTKMNQALHELRSALPGVRLVLAAMGPKMCRLAGSSYDGAFFNWMTPDFAASARLNVEWGAGDVPRDPPTVFGYVRAAIGADASERLAKEEAFYRDLHDGYRTTSIVSRSRRAQWASPPPTGTRPSPRWRPTRPWTCSSFAASRAPASRRWPRSPRPPRREACPRDPPRLGRLAEPPGADHARVQTSDVLYPSAKSAIAFGTPRPTEQSASKRIGDPPPDVGIVGIEQIVLARYEFDVPRARRDVPARRF